MRTSWCAQQAGAPEVATGLQATVDHGVHDRRLPHIHHLATVDDEPLFGPGERRVLPLGAAPGGVVKVVEELVHVERPRPIRRQRCAEFLDGGPAERGG